MRPVSGRARISFVLCHAYARVSQLLGLYPHLARYAYVRPRCPITWGRDDKYPRVWVKSCLRVTSTFSASSSINTSYRHTHSLLAQYLSLSHEIIYTASDRAAQIREVNTVSLLSSIEMHLRNVASFACVASAAIAPLHLKDRSSCNADNCLRALERNSPAADAFCALYTSVTATPIICSYSLYPLHCGLIIIFFWY